ncbi:unnamed protein product, partial [Oikopleura dioica]
MEELEQLKAENAKLKTRLRTYEEVPTPSSDNEKTIVVDECLIDVIKTMNGIVKEERAKMEKYREDDHKHYQESVDELHSHYKEQMDTIQDEAKKQIKDIEGQYKSVFEERMNE